ncbi:hypothetical protein B0H11DRAFT_1912589 [Mycena galericulata]|nr:hypothetical protein B0H11DRAFT_1912589 [Mycena galericulata]
MAVGENVAKVEVAMKEAAAESRFATETSDPGTLGSVERRNKALGNVWPGCVPTSKRLIREVVWPSVEGTLDVRPVSTRIFVACELLGSQQKKTTPNPGTGIPKAREKFNSAFSFDLDDRFSEQLDQHARMKIRADSMRADASFRELMQDGHGTRRVILSTNKILSSSARATKYNRSSKWQNSNHIEVVEDASLENGCTGAARQDTPGSSREERRA